MTAILRAPNISRSKLNKSQNILLEKQDAIVLANGKTAFGEDFYVYLQVNKAALEQMHQDEQSKKIINFFNYGNVLEFGEGITPPQDTTERIKEQYGDIAKPWWG